MPSRNSRKLYVENGYYHVYNRGVEKRNIFLDDQDYRVFLSFIRAYLSPPSFGPLKNTKPTTKHPVTDVTGRDPVRVRPLKNFFEHVSLLAFCLMPNHFHMLLWQKEMNSMTKFIQALCTSYSMYFNKRYKRVGTLFQGPYKAALVDNDIYLLHLTRYIHLNPFEDQLTRRDLVGWEYAYSSYAHYLGKKRAVWVHPEPILAFYSSKQQKQFYDYLSYKSFVENYKEDPHEPIGLLAID